MYFIKELFASFAVVEIKHSIHLFIGRQHTKFPNLISMQSARFFMLYDNSCSYPCLFLMCQKSMQHQIRTWRLNATFRPLLWDSIDHGLCGVQLRRAK